MFRLYITKFGNPSNNKSSNEKILWQELDEIKINFIFFNIENFILSEDDHKVKENSYRKLYLSLLNLKNSDSCKKFSKIR